MEHRRSRQATREDHDDVVDTLVLAFATDPLVRWFFPDDESYGERAAAFFGFLFDIRIEHGEVRVTEDRSAAALWTPPGGLSMSDEEVDARWVAQVEPGAGPGESARLAAFGAAVDEMRPAGPHWYLGVLGTDPARRGRGLARAVLEPVLDRATRTDSPVFLETGTPGNLPFYARFGFDELASRRLSDGPTVWALWRRPS